MMYNMEGFTRLDNDRLVKDTLTILENLLQNDIIFKSDDDHLVDIDIDDK